MNDTHSLDIKSGGFIDSWLPYLMLGILTLSLTCNVAQGWYLRNLRSAMAMSRPPLEKKTGQMVTPLNAASFSGNLSTIQLSGQRTILYIFDPNCHWCALNLSSIKSLSSSTSGHYRVIGISRTSTGLADYLQENKLPFPVFVDTQRTDYAQLDFVGTPQTVLISSDGKVEHNWPGAYMGETKKAVESYFKAKLPDISVTQ